jgi:hypothetical protein
MTSALEFAVRELLTELDESVRSRDLARTLDLFAPETEVLLLGSEAGESATGWDELVGFLTHLYSRPIRFGWAWDRVEARARGEAVWFMAEGDVVEATDAGDRRTPYRFTGVAIRVDDLRLKLALIHGSEPVSPK